VAAGVSRPGWLHAAHVSVGGTCECVDIRPPARLPFCALSSLPARPRTAHHRHSAPLAQCAPCPAPLSAEAAVVPRGVPRQVRGARRGRGDNIPGAMGRRTLRGPATDWREEVLLEQRLQLLGPPQSPDPTADAATVRWVPGKVTATARANAHILVVCVCSQWASIGVPCEFVRAIFIPCARDHIPPNGGFLAKSFWPKESNFSSRFQRCRDPRGVLGKIHLG
jgi:hypothetical protein